MNGDVMNMLSSIMQDPAAMEKAISMARALSSSGILEGIKNDVSENKADNGELDLKSILGSNTSKSEESRSQDGKKISQNERIALLLAIRPYLSSDNAKKLDNVIHVLKIVGAIEKSGIKLF